jgi:hypothetical protein
MDVEQGKENREAEEELRKAFPMDDIWTQAWGPEGGSHGYVRKRTYWKPLKWENAWCALGTARKTEKEEKEGRRGKGRDEWLSSCELVICLLCSQKPLFRVRREMDDTSENSFLHNLGFLHSVYLLNCMTQHAVHVCNGKPNEAAICDLHTTCMIIGYIILSTKAG